MARQMLAYTYPAAMANGAGPECGAEALENPVMRTAHRATIIAKEHFKRFRMHKHRFGTGVNVVWGIKPEWAKGPRGGLVSVHAITFDRKLFSPSQAKAWLRGHGYKAIRFEAAQTVARRGAVVAGVRRVATAANPLPAGVSFHYLAGILAANPGLSGPTEGFINGYLKAQKQLGSRPNPSLMLLLANPRGTRKAPRVAHRTGSRAIALAERAYKRFHFTAPKTQEKAQVPDGWPACYITIGACERFDVKDASGRKVSRSFTNPMPKLATTKDMKDVFIFGHRPLGIPAGRAMRVDYRVPPHSGRNKWARRWWHPHESHPNVTVDRTGRAVRISGPGLSVTPRGIVG